MAQKYLKVNTEKKIITIDDNVKPTATDLADKQDYLKAGYQIRHKSQKRAEAARKRAKETNFGKKKAN